MGSLDKRLWDLACAKASGRMVLEVVRGVRYTAALLDNGRVGLAYSFSDMVMPEEEASAILSSLPVDAAEALGLSSSRCPGDRAVALAVANGLLPVEGELSGAIPRVEPGAEVLMVGRMEPLENKLVALDAKVFFADHHRCGGLDDKEALDMASRCDLVVLSASAIVNGTWERFVELARDCWVAGPSAPLCWDVYKETSVSAVLGRSVKSPQALMRIVSRGCGTRFFDPFTDRVLLCGGPLCD
ncbi:hypothetical protein TheveDRAFT_1734 [Thermanaerovibrio velox DSM 12556]|uniref:Heavy-metal chelation domain-containing protein n=1 Tax=Thermanaerovibrio velox DSM 12556 TaxID=926567 RepID=H0UR15_9BACT|nr:DUF364 domain-containing protein [Thermanaerovibrio velox]EHM10852.1 hypothetical protein TheveDRAFT_1734 [Thermanaerovibrio velox DSM 12556]